jgi:hypothetical protein
VPERATVDVPTPVGGWLSPWPEVAEIEAVLPSSSWTLVGGLMTQLHAVHRGIGIVRPTDDVDIVLHVETTAGAPGAAARALESIGYTMLDPVDPRADFAHRFRRGNQHVDLVGADDDVVDVLVADHVPPRAAQTLRGRTMVAIEGGTQALQRTVDATLRIRPGATTTVSVPSVLGAVVLKAAAYRTDSREPARHLLDSAVLLACLDDPYSARAQLKGSDRGRLLTLRRNLPDGAPQWRQLGPEQSRDGRTALLILTAGLT